MILVRIIERENAKKPTLPKWRETQLKKFVQTLNMLAGELDRAHRKKLMPTLAWSARSILELLIWVEYCCTSEENAKRFRDDSARDLYGMSIATIALIKHTTGVEDPDITAAMDKLADFVKSWGVLKLGDDFKRVAEAAKELGKEKIFFATNKFLSKLAHPTAWVINSIASLDADAMARDKIYEDAVVMSRKALKHIRDLILRTFPKPGHEDELNF